MSSIYEALELLDLEGWLETNNTSSIKKAGGDERRIEVCPKCLDNRHKLYVNVQKKTWICFNCDWGRGKTSIIDFLASVSNKLKSEIYSELLKTVIPSDTTSLVTKLEDIFNETPNCNFNIPEPKEIELPGTNNWNSLTTHPVLNYAYSRGLTPEMVSYLQLRYSDKLPTSKGYEVTGPWLLFPVFFGKKAVAWQGRRVGSNKDPKYFGNANIKEWLWPLSDLFFQFYKNKTVILTEGVFDALGFLSVGIPALCTFGKSLSSMQLQLLQELHPSEVAFAWDLDAYKSTLNIVDKVSHIFSKISVITFDEVNNKSSSKVDAGDALVNVDVADYIKNAFSQRIDTKSSKFFQYRMLKSCE
jgi:hypothetical protein